MRPPGVTNHHARIHAPMDNIRREFDAALDRVMTCRPDYIVMGMSAETFWDGRAESERLRARVRTGLGVAMGSDACRAALAACGGARRIAVVTPYWPVGDRNVVRFFEECGARVDESHDDGAEEGRTEGRGNPNYAASRRLRRGAQPFQADRRPVGEPGDQLQLSAHRPDDVAACSAIWWWRSGMAALGVRMAEMRRPERAPTHRSPPRRTNGDRGARRFAPPRR
jgi:hypothetical protein